VRNRYEEDIRIENRESAEDIEASLSERQDARRAKLAASQRRKKRRTLVALLLAFVLMATMCGRDIIRLKAENAELKKLRDEQNAKDAAEQKVAGWMEESKQVKAIYPQFDLKGELQNPKFVDLLRVPGVDVRTAYELTHKDEIIAGAMQFTAKTVEKKIADKIAANGARPTENGLNSQSASLTKSDVSQLSKAERAEINRKVLRGEKVSFG
jgi:hypothetical protein